MTTISSLASAAALSGTEPLPIDQSGATVKATVNQVKTYVNTTPAITGGSINSTPIGATAPSTGAFTSLSASGLAVTAVTGAASALITATTGTASAYIVYTNTGGSYYVGIENSTGGSFSSTPYALVQYAPVGRTIQTNINSNIITSVSSSGLAVTGNISSTGRTLVGTTTDDGVNALQVNGTIAVGKGRISPVTATTGITTTPTSIYTVGSSYCSVLKVFITDSATHSALDVIAVGSGGVTVTVMTSANLVGVSPARVYTIASNIVKVSIASTTCNARVIADEFI